MKKITYILACACMMGLTSCADTFLDLEPLDSRTDAVYFKKPPSTVMQSDIIPAPQK